MNRALDALRVGAEGTDNLLPLMRTALDAHATVGEVCGVLREIFRRLPSPGHGVNRAAMRSPGSLTA